MGPSKNAQKKTGRNRRGGNKRSTFSASGPVCVMPPPTRQVYKFERTLYSGTLVSTAADKGWSFSYTLGSFPGAAEFTSLFDLYRMTGLEITFTLAGASGFEPTLSMLADYDSYTTPTTLDQIGQRPHKRVTLTTTMPAYTFKLNPRVMSVVQTSSGVGSSALAPRGQWLDCNDSTVVYGGLIGWISNYTAGNGVILQVTVRSMFDFAMVR